MWKCTKPSIIAVAIVALLSTPAAGSGLITGLNVSAPSVAAGVQVQVTVRGSGTCGQMVLSLGDSAAKTLTSVNLPYGVSHSYTKAGTMTITAKGVTSCQGQASATVQVKSNLAILCSKVDCVGLSGLGKALSTATTCPTPNITAAFVPAPLEPGNEVILNGECFGPDASQVRLGGQFPGGFAVLETIQWQKDLVRARVPLLTGVKDQTAKLQVVRKDFKVSNEWPVQFLAMRDTIKLAPGDISVDCANESSRDECNFFGVDAHLGPGGTFYAWHSNTWGNISTDCGTDRFSIKLQNGWVLKKMKGPRWYTSDKDDLPFVPKVLGFSPGSSSDVIKVKWCIDPDNGVGYKVKVYAIGPAGVPYK